MINLLLRTIFTLKLPLDFPRERESIIGFMSAENEQKLGKGRLAHEAKVLLNQARPEVVEEKGTRETFPGGLTADYDEQTDSLGVWSRHVRLREETEGTLTVVEVSEWKEPGIFGQKGASIRLSGGAYTNTEETRPVEVKPSGDRREVIQNVLDILQHKQETVPVRLLTFTPDQTNTPNALTAAQRLVSRVVQARQQPK